MGKQGRRILRFRWVQHASSENPSCCALRFSRNVFLKYQPPPPQKHSFLANNSVETSACGVAQVGKQEKDRRCWRLMRVPYLSWDPKLLRSAVFLFVFPINPPQKNNPFLANNSAETSSTQLLRGACKWESKKIMTDFADASDSCTISSLRRPRVIAPCGFLVLYLFFIKNPPSKKSLFGQQQPRGNLSSRRRTCSVGRMKDGLLWKYLTRVPSPLFPPCFY